MVLTRYYKDGTVFLILDNLSICASLELLQESLIFDTVLDTLHVFCVAVRLQSTKRQVQQKDQRAVILLIRIYTNKFPTCLRLCLLEETRKLKCPATALVSWMSHLYAQSHIAVV